MKKQNLWYHFQHILPLTDKAEKASFNNRHNP